MLILLWWLFITTICVYICWIDVRERKISNNSVFWLCSLLFISVLIYNSEVYFCQPAIVLFCGILLWKLGIFGAGDVKLASVFSILISPDYYLLVVVMMLVLGGIEALMYIIVKKLKPTLYTQNGIPFAPPIVVSGLFGIAASI